MLEKGLYHTVQSKLQNVLAMLDWDYIKPLPSNITTTSHDCFIRIMHKIDIVTFNNILV
jgi:hypothetical protein